MADISPVKQASITESADDIRKQRSDVLLRFEKFQESTKHRRKRLEDAKQYLYFRKAADELEQWLMEKLHALSDDSYKVPTNLQAKLQRHQGFEAEVAAHEKALSALDEDGANMINNNHEASQQIQSKLEDLHRLWDELQRRVAEKMLNLQHIQNLVQFQRECDEIKVWIEEKETFLLSEDFGNDLEHVEVLQKRFDEFRKDLQNHDPEVMKINETATQLLQDQPGDEEAVRAKAQEVIEAWERLKGSSQSHENSLYGAHELQHFGREIDEAIDWIAEKDAALANEDCGKDLPTVQALQRKHSGLERDLAALKDKVETLDNKATELAQTHPDQAKEVQAKQAELIEKWDQLKNKAAERRVALDNSYHLQRFLADYRDLSTWIHETSKIMKAEEMPKDVAGAEALLDRHSEIKGEIMSREDNFVKLRQDGKELIDSKHYASAEIKDKLKTIAKEKKALDELWEERQAMYEQGFYLQMLYRDMDQAEAWLAKKQAILSAADTDENLDVVENQLKRQDNIEKSLSAQDEKIQKLDNLASKMIEDKHFAADEISAKRSSLLERRNLAHELAKKKKVPTATLR